jgi:2-C-methyl-D-erythritol 4-phosphate cytidylyltransferase
MGTRVGGNTPKQLLPLADGRSVLEHSVDAFEAASCIDEIVIVMHPEWIKEAEELCRRNTWQKVRQIIAGGSERWESSWHAIQAFSGQLSEISLWLHDAARPFVSQRILSDVAKALETHAAVTVAVPVTDTLYKVRRDDVQGTKEVEAIPSRADFMRAQTPQAFHLDVLKEAFERALAQGQVAVTDDVGIVQAYMPEQSIFIVSGEEANRKITYAEDL